jgi:hypothetical protein
METDDERDHSPTRKGWGRWRWLRAIAGVLGGYIALAVLSTGIMFAGVMVSRALGKDPRADDDSLPRIKHLRWADDKLLAGAQPNRNDYAGLADLGVALVVDVRTGSDDDPILDDPEYLRRSVLTTCVCRSAMAALRASRPSINLSTPWETPTASCSCTAAEGWAALPPFKRVRGRQWTRPVFVGVSRRRPPDS